MIAQNAVELEPQGEAAEEPTSGGPSRFMLWLVAFSLGFLLLPLYLISTTIQENIAPLQDQVATLEIQLSSTPAPNPEEETLSTELLNLSQQISALEAVQAELEANHINWPGVMAQIAAYDQNVIRLTELTQTDVHISLNGAAQDESVVSAYADSLRASDLFDSVAVQSLNLHILPTATPAPTATAAPDAEATASDQPAPTQAAKREVQFTILITLRTGGDAGSE